MLLLHTVLHTLGIQRSSCSARLLTAFALLLVAAAGQAQLPLVQLGLEQDGDKVQVIIRPDQPFAGALTSSIVTIRWATTTGVVLNTGAASFNNPAYTAAVGPLTYQNSYVNGDSTYAVFTTVYGGSPLPTSWAANTNVPFFQVPFTNASGACVSFQVANSPWQEVNNRQWSIYLNAADRTNGYIPGAAAFCAPPLGVQLGLEQAGDKVQVLLRPNQPFSGALTGSTVTIRWATTPGVVLNTGAASFNNPAYTAAVGPLTYQNSYVNGDSTYAVFTTVYGGSPLPTSWAANTNVPFFQVPFTNTSGACVTFEVANSPWQEVNNRQWFISLDAVDRTNGYIPGSAAFCADPNALVVNARAILDGPWMEADNLMRDALRTLPGFPLAQPYTTAPFSHSGTESTAPAVLAATGNNAVVDWVLLELRDATTPTTILARRAALLQRDGDIVDTDGSGPVVMLVPPTGNHHLAVRHRNHLGTMTLTALPTAAGTPLTVDFTLPGTLVFGDSARSNVNGTMTLWCGNTLPDHQVVYLGLDDDRDPILSLVGHSDLNNTVTGYHPTDVNMDGVVIYLGQDNDRDHFLLRTLGGSDLNKTRPERLP